MVKGVTWEINSIVMMENIKKLYKEIEDKKGLICAIAKEFKMREVSVRSNWFCRFWTIPEYRIDRTIEIMQNWRKQEINRAKQ